MKTKVVEYIGRMQDGGAETLVKDYALLLDKEKFDVTVICEDYRKGSANYEILKKQGIRCLYTYGIFDYTCRALGRIFGSKFKAFLLQKYIAEIDPDIIHIHLESLDVIKQLSDRLQKVKLFFTCHNVPEVCVGSKRPKENEACRYLLEHNGLRIIALHEQMANELKELFAINNVIVLRNGIDFSRFLDIDETKEEIRKKIGIPVDSYLIGHIGRFAYQKNHEFLLKVFNEVSKLNDKSQLLLIGEGKLKEKILKQIDDLGLKERVTILSHRTDIPYLLKSMDVYLFPSRFEGLSVSMIEAQISGLPCVISNNISKETYCSENITELSYEDPLKKWANACLNPKGNIKEWNEKDDYDLNKNIKKLEEIYLVA